VQIGLQKEHLPSSGATRFPGRSRFRRGAQRGFTIVELLAVIVIIGILAAAASPVFVRLLRDGRVSNAASQVADMVRMARTRALGRGSAVLVRWNFNQSVPTDIQPVGRLSMREAIVGVDGACSLAPATYCQTTDWSNNSQNSKLLMSFDDRSTQYWPTQLSFRKPDATPATYAEICFSPRGRTYIRYTAQGVFEVLAGALLFQAQNQNTTMSRYVVVPPNGVARIVTRVK